MLFSALVSSNVCSPQASESLENLAGVIYNEKKCEMEAKRVLDNLRMCKLKEIFTTVAIACHRFERLAVLQNDFPIILL